MSLSDRRTVLACMGASAIGLSGCLRPMLARDGTAKALRHRIALPPIDDRFDYFLSKALADRLGAPENPDYRLNVKTTMATQGLAIAQDNSITRVTLLVNAKWSLWRAGVGAPVMTDSVDVQSGYSATTSLYATRQVRLDIERRLAREIGERISRKILAQSGQLGA
ncbi:MAG: hypothetical protein AAF557_07420 [Pseudomonadota bacterium]